MPAVGDHELAAECRSAVRGEENGSPVGPARAPSHIVLEHEQVEQLVGGHERRRPNVNESPLDAIERGMGAKLVGVHGHVVTTKSASDDGTQQPGGWLDDERDRHGQRR